VRYGQLIASVREIQRGGETTPSVIDRTLLHLLSHAPYSQSAATLTGIYRKIGLSSITSTLGGKSMERLNSLLPPNIETTPWKETYPAKGEPLGRIGLFTGCISRITDRAALNASIRILNRVGYEVIVPSKQGCCGAMHFNSGDSSKAESMAKQNSNAFSGLGLDAVVGVASGCVSHLQELPQDSGLSESIMDISAFLCSIPSIEDIKPFPLNKRVVIHTPCSMKNVLKQEVAPYKLLQLIPEIELINLPENGICCGAAGLYIISNPEEADTLREDKINGLRESKAEIMVTSNTGCALHLTAGIRKADMEIEVLHPVELLARQLSD
jgi:glycolate oxidase iron-sulfur subunit